MRTGRGADQNTRIPVLILPQNDVAERFKSPTTATLTVTYHLDSDPANPDQWSGTITTPPIRVNFYRMKSWSLLG